MNKEIKGFVENSAVILTINKLNCFNYNSYGFEVFTLEDVNKSQIVDIKSFKRFIKSNKEDFFKDVVGDLIFIKNNDKLYICDKNVNYGVNIRYKDKSYNKIVIIDLLRVKKVFREFKLNDINSLRVFYKKDYPVFFEININDGFLIAPRIENEWGN